MSQDILWRGAYKRRSLSCERDMGRLVPITQLTTLTSVRLTFFTI